MSEQPLLDIRIHDPAEAQQAAIMEAGLRSIGWYQEPHKIGGPLVSATMAEQGSPSRTLPEQSSQPEPEQSPEKTQFLARMEAAISNPKTPLAYRAWLGRDVNFPASTPDFPRQVENRTGFSSVASGAMTESILSKIEDKFDYATKSKIAAEKAQDLIAVLPQAFPDANGQKGTVVYYDTTGINGSSRVTETFAVSLAAADAEALQSAVQKDPSLSRDMAQLIAHRVGMTDEQRASYAPQLDQSAGANRTAVLIGTNTPGIGFRFQTDVAQY